ncbi:hypothetical protein [Acinetobacter sp. YH12080]|uniref:hypothetical protein n=1 Tax=Acinetobacter sp. YH12080 TaxID=2601073 RepID=UPI0015D21172|nr:hypothetical protein [Acinetobacter sp. YH12080]
MYDPSNLEILVAEVKGTGQSEYWGLAKQIPLRLELPIFARVEALHEMISQNQKTPRNKVLNDLINIALDEVMKKLDDETVEKLNQMSGHHYQAFIDSCEVSDLSDEAKK